MSKYIFVVGGVMSGVGKGVATASIGRILQQYGYKVSAIKIDPYINVDAGTMNPVEHGEVFVSDDGLESDQDLGNYERFLEIKMGRIHYMTTGSVYESVIHRERSLGYGGKCVEVIPHIPEEVIRRIEHCTKVTKADFTLIEIGGTVGEYQNLVFLEAARMMKLKAPKNVRFVMVSYLPTPAKIGEMKTKPTQYAVRTLNSAGIQPDFIVARATTPLDQPRKQKLAVFCNINENDVISAPDIESIYEVPVNFDKEGLGASVLKKFGMRAREDAKKAKEWEDLVARIQKTNKATNGNVVKIGIVGKYFSTGHFVLSDSYLSVIEAVKHACWKLGKKPEIAWLNADDYDGSTHSTDSGQAGSPQAKEALNGLKKYDGIVVPGGFGSRGIEGKINVIGFCRQKKIPFFGLCYGMQLAVIEAARSLLGLKEAHTTEVNPKTPDPIIHISEDQKENIAKNSYGGSMRLGAYSCELSDDSLSRKLYGEKIISERHRHRYEFNNDYKDMLIKKGMTFAGINTERNLVEIVEMKNHPFFVGVQFHPEFQSTPLKSHPLFLGFIKAASKK